MADNAAEVADDYRQALEDLTMNSRIEIATLTNIARENANHGLAIAEVLTNHIKRVPPARTLPALYVLDSVVKNVPTPYALYFGPKLYTIFMGAYAKVDNATRRKMDEMLKTWKEPVPGSISTKPVFPPDLVRPIENALIAVRQAAFAANQSSLQGQQQYLRGARPNVPARDTPTPPMARPPAQPFPGPNGQGQHHMDSAQQPYPIRPHNDTGMTQKRATPPQPFSLPVDQAPPHQQPAQPISIEKLKDDIQQLIVAGKNEFARDPRDTSKQTRLKALLDLQTIIQSQNMPQAQLMLIKERVAELAVNMRLTPVAPVAAASAPMPPLAPYTSTPTPPVALGQQPTPVVPVSVARPPSVPAMGAAPPPAAGGGLTLDAILGQGALAALLSKMPKPATSAAAFSPATPTLPASPSVATIPSPPPQIAAVRPQPQPQLPLVQSPALAHTPTPIPAPAPPPSALASNPTALLAMLRQSGLLQPSPAATPSLKSPQPLQFTLAQLKQHRPYHIPRAYSDLGPPCTQCGRRFSTDDAGRRKKTAHMDWHFRVHQRIAEYEKRGQSRSPLFDELDWIETAVAVDSDYVHPSSSGDSPEGLKSAGPTVAGNAKSGKGAAAVPYIPAPEHSSRVNSSCPICQERFEMKWLDEAQEWVWMDAVKMGERVFHASCYREASGDGGARGTPEPVLGKRKAEDDFSPFKAKLKMEGY